jgi:hypothetical protein
MQLTFWQQFSSNHSAMYTVVGVFATPATAQDAYAKLREIIQAIAADQRGSRNADYMTAAEIRIAEQYGIEWQLGLDWRLAMETEPRHFRNPPYTVDDAINIIDNLVVVDAPAVFTWQAGHQFTALIRVMGGSVFRGIYYGRDPDNSEFLFIKLKVDISCAIPRKETAFEIMPFLSQYLQNDRNERYKLPMPWAMYHPRLTQIAPDLLPAAYAAAEQKYLDGEQLSVIHELRDDTRLPDGTCDFQEGRLKLRFDDLMPSGTSISLTALIAWLKAHGCTDFQYEFQQAER